MCTYRNGERDEGNDVLYPLTSAQDIRQTEVAALLVGQLVVPVLPACFACLGVPDGCGCLFCLSASWMYQRIVYACLPACLPVCLPGWVYLSIHPTPGAIIPKHCRVTHLLPSRCVGINAQNP